MLLTPVSVRAFRLGTPVVRGLRDSGTVPCRDFCADRTLVMEDPMVDRTGSLPHVRVVGFEPLPSMSAPDDPHKHVLGSFLQNETITVSSPLSQMLGGLRKSSSRDGSPGSGFFSANSSDSDRSGDVARRFDTQETAAQLMRRGSMEMTSEVCHDLLGSESFKRGRETPPIDIPYQRGYRHPRTQR